MERVLIVGHGRSGKDECGAFLGTLPGFKYGGSASLALLPHVVRRLRELGMWGTEQSVYNCRHAYRELWYTVGKEVRQSDPLALFNAISRGGNVTAGIREMCELEAVVGGNLVDHIIWIERDYEPDPTMDFSLQDVVRTVAHSGHDINVHVVINNGSIEDYVDRLRSLARNLRWLNDN